MSTNLKAIKLINEQLILILSFVVLDNLNILLLQIKL